MTAGSGHPGLMGNKSGSGSHKIAVDALAAVLHALDVLEESEQLWVIESATRRLGLVNEVPAKRRVFGGEDRTVDADADKSEVSPKDFMKSKRPVSDVHRIACLAYYLHHHRGQHQFKTADLTALNTEAAGVRIGNPSQAVANATKQSLYLAAAGGGKKQITALGEEVVAALPNADAVRAAEQEHRPVRKKRKSKGTRETRSGQE
jgi:hypothetical protein